MLPKFGTVGKPLRYKVLVKNLTPKVQGGLSVKDQVRGKAEEIKGRVTGNRTEKLKGQARQKLGDAKSTVRDIKGDVREAANRRKGK